VLASIIVGVFPGRVAEWLKATDCKSVEDVLRRFESYLSQPSRLDQFLDKS
jgi:hypothetical protein